MTTRALTAAAAIAAAIALAGCAIDDAPAPPAATTRSTVAPPAPAPTSTTATTTAPVRVLDDPRVPSTPALRRAVRAFYSTYVAYVYGADPRLPAPTTARLRAQLAARGPVAGLEDLHPRLRELRVAPIAADLAAVSAGVDDGRADGELQEIPARMRRVDGHWRATSVAEGEGQ